MDKTLCIEIPVAWHFIRNIKRLIEENLASFPESLRYATSMVAAELIGNAIKYGESTPEAPHATFFMQVTDQKIVIEVRNGVTSPERVRDVTQRVEQMSTSPSKEDVYLERLQELLSGSSRGSQLGLYRIGYEGEFDLDCTYTGSVLSVRATRGLS